MEKGEGWRRTVRKEGRKEKKDGDGRWGKVEDGEGR